MTSLQILQVINTLLLFSVLPFSISLLYSLTFHIINNRRDIVRFILILVFASITIAAIISLHVNYLLLIKEVSASQIVLEANIRNLVKNFAFFITAFGFWYIEKKIKN